MLTRMVASKLTLLSAALMGWIFTLFVVIAQQG